MPNSAGITTENELAKAVVKILSSTSTKSATYAQLIAAIPSIIALTAADRVPSGKREGEEMWEQRVRNITSHKNAEGNFVYKGVLETIPGGLKLP